jgi:hypothetical protein
MPSRSFAERNEKRADVFPRTRRSPFSSLAALNDTLVLAAIEPVNTTAGPGWKTRKFQAEPSNHRNTPWGTCERRKFGNPVA